VPIDDAEVHRVVGAWLTASPPHRLPNNADDAAWQAAKWGVIVHGTGALLGARGAEAFPDAPQWFLHFLAEQRGFTAARVGRLLSEAYGLRAAADRARIDVVALKGVALSQVPGFPIEARPLNDIDLLVREAQRPVLEMLLQEHGYQISEESPRHREYTCQRFNITVVYREGDHPDNPVKLEVHTWVGQELLSARRLEITAALWEAREAPYGVMLHLLLHTGSSAAKRRLRQVQLHDIALLAPSIEPEDWAWIVQHAIRAQAAPLVYSALRLAERFAALRTKDIPQEVLRACCGEALLQVLENEELRSFTMAGGSLSVSWECQWLPRGEALWRWKLRRAVPLHRLLLDPVRLRERYGLPLDAPPVLAYAIHIARATVWPLIVVLRIVRGKS